MQILTKFLLAGALAATIAPLCGFGADTDAQTKAREALRQKMSELEVQPVDTNAAPVVAPKKAPKAKATPAPVVTEPAPVPETVKTVPAPTLAPARTVETPQTPAPAPARTVEAEPPPAPAPVVKTTPPAKSPPVAKSSSASGQVTATRADSERIAKAREALELKMRELEGQPPVASQPPVSTSSPGIRAPEIGSTRQPNASTEMSETLPTPPPVKRSAEAESQQPQKSKKPREGKPMPEPRPMYALPPGPPPPVSAEKVQQLQTLLQQYQADRITPEQYHAERAKILAGP